MGIYYSLKLVSKLDILHKAISQWKNQGHIEGGVGGYKPPLISKQSKEKKKSRKK